MAAKKTKKKITKKKTLAKTAPRSGTKAKAAKKVHAKVKGVPDSAPQIIPCFRGPGCGEEVAFLKEVFDAQEMDRFSGADGTIFHCELRIGTGVVMCGDGMGAAKLTLCAMIYVPNCDDVLAKAVAAGATLVEPAKDQFYGDRTARVVDPFGNEWIMATHLEDVSRKEQHHRLEKMMTGAA